MKRSMILISFSLLATACSTNNASETNGLPNSPIFAPALKLSCVETQTFVDAPGQEHALSIRQALKSASVQSRSISMEGYGEWEIGQLPYAVEESYGENGELTLSLEENVDKEVDWSKSASCYKLVAQQSFRVTRDAEGNWKGTAQLIGNILTDPAVDCDFPHIARPPQRDLACTEQ